MPPLLFYTPRSLLFALCSLPLLFALRPLLFALRPLPFALRWLYSIVTLSIFTSETGLSLRPVCVVAMSSTTSWPSVTRPKMV